MAALLRYSSVSLRGSDPNRVAVCPAAIYVTYTLCGDDIILCLIYRKVKVSADFAPFDPGGIILRCPYFIALKTGMNCFCLVQGNISGAGTVAKSAKKMAG
jgi:hypothetical protein